MMESPSKIKKKLKKKIEKLANLFQQCIIIANAE